VAGPVRPTLGRRSVPVDTLLRLLYLKHRYGLGDESLCREVADSLSWRRFCRIGLDRPVPHPTTLMKLVRRAGPEVIEKLNAALVTKLAADKLLRARKLRVDTTVVEADIDYPTDADLLEHAVRKLGGLVRRVKGPWCASRTRFRDRGRAAGRRMKQLARTLRRRTGVAMAEVDRPTGQVAQLARRSLREVHAVWRNAHRALTRRPHDGRLGRLVGELQETMTATDQRLAGNRVIPDRLVSLADRHPLPPLPGWRRVVDRRAFKGCARRSRLATGVNRRSCDPAGAAWASAASRSVVWNSRPGWVSSRARWRRPLASRRRTTEPS
jgi:IS5 family transposase